MGALSRLALLLFLLCTFHAAAQPTIFILSIDASEWPTMRATFLAFDSEGNVVRDLTPGDVVLTENGVPCKVISITCPEDVVPEPISSVLTLDVSGSMQNEAVLGSGETRMSIARSAARAWIRQMDLTESECAVTSFDDRAYLEQEFTNDRTLLLAAVDRLGPQGGTNYADGFLQPGAGGIPVAATGKHKRIMVFLTDGQDRTDVTPILQAAFDNKVTIYTVAVAMEAPDILRQIAEQTGGDWFEQVNSELEAVRIYEKILYESQGLEPCVIEWESYPDCRLARDVQMTVPARGLEGNASYSVPGTILGRLLVLPHHLSFGTVPPGADSVRTAVIRAETNVMTVTKLSSDNPRFEVTPVGFTLPEEIPAGEERTLAVRFTPADSSAAYAHISIETASCINAELFASGGSYGYHVPLVLEAPNGGEVFQVGTDTDIRWRGTHRNQPVLLEYSTDAGGNWMEVADAASGLLHNWTVPNTPSLRCLARVTEQEPYDDARAIGNLSGITDLRFTPDGRRTAVVSAAKNEIYLLEPDGDSLRIVKTFVHPSVRAVRFSPDGTRLVSLSTDGTVMLWNIATGRLTHVFHHPDAVTDAAFSPDGLFLATACGDEDIRVRSVDNGSLIASLSHTERVNTVEFNIDGTRLYTAGESLWEWEDQGGWSRTQEYQPNVGTVRALRLEQEKGTLLAVVGDARMQMLNTTTGTFDAGYDIDLPGQGGPGPFTGTATMVTGGDLVIRDLSDAVVVSLPSRNAPLTMFDIAPGGLLLAVAEADGTVALRGTRPHPLRSDISDSLWAIVAPAVNVVDIDFGLVEVGLKKDTTVTTFIANVGSIPVTVSTVELQGNEVGDFMILSGSSNITVQPGSQSAISFRFTPGAAGLRTTSALLQTSAGPLTARLTGEGFVRKPNTAAAATASLHRLPPQTCSSTPFDTVVTLLSTGELPLHVSDVELAGPDASDFAITATVAPAVVAPGGQLDIPIRFQPGGPGARTAELRITSNADGTPVITTELNGQLDVADVVADVNVVDFGIVCPGETLDTLLTIRNVGTLPTPLRINVEAPFSAPEPSTVLAPNQVFNCAVHFAGSSEPGEYSTILSLTDSCGNTLPVQLRAQVVRPDLAAEPLAMFAFLGSSADSVVKLSNPTDADLLITDATIADTRFRILDPLPPFVVPAGETLPVAIRFTPDNEDTVSGSLMLTAAPCALNLTVPVTGRAASALTVVSLPSVEAFAGERITVPLKLEQQTNLLISGAERFTAIIRFDKSLLLPIPAAGMRDLGPDGTGRRIEIEGTLPNDGEPAARLEFVAALGSAEETPLTIESFVWQGALVQVETIDGLFTLKGICREGGPRLFDEDGRLALKQPRPTPADERVTVEYSVLEEGPVRLTIADLRGHTVMTAIDGNQSPGSYLLDVDISVLNSGTYICLLETPSGRLSRPLVIER